MKPIYLLPLLTVLLLPCSAEDFTLADGSVLHDAHVVRQDDETATIRHTTGVQRIPYTRLTPELQKRLGLTPEEVNARRAAAREAERQRAEAREKKAAEQRAALVTSGLSPRYMTGADVISLYSAWSTLSAPAAEYLAAEWNRREALRCGLTVEARRYKEDAAVLARNIERERAEEIRTRERLAVAEKELDAAKRDLQQARLAVQQLEKQNAELKERPAQATTTTVVVSEPRVVPVYRPQPIILPPVHQPRPPIVRPTPPVQQVRPSGVRPMQPVSRPRADNTPSVSGRVQPH